MKIKEINRMVVKIGSSLLIDKDKGVNNNFLNNISEDILSLKKRGIETLVVSSGAIELGKIELDKTKEKFNLAESQAASSIGQIKLINSWKESLSKFDLNAAQILITAEDTVKLPAPSHLTAPSTTANDRLAVAVNPATNALMNVR